MRIDSCFFLNCGLPGSSLAWGAENASGLQKVLLEVSRDVNARSTSGVARKPGLKDTAPAVVRVYTQEDLRQFPSVYDLLRTVPA